jgi:hypothetical protein
MEDTALLNIVNSGACAVIQVMSGRSAENSQYEVLDGCSAIRPRGSDHNFQFAEYVWRDLFAHREKSFTDRLVLETQKDWITKYRTLLQNIHVPKVLLWISRRGTHAYPSCHSSALDEFPHFVAPWMLDELISLVDAFCDGTSKRGSPQILSDRFTGYPIDVERPEIKFRYQSGYPSPEMHEDIANVLFATLRKLVPAPW